MDQRTHTHHYFPTEYISARHEGLKGEGAW